MSTVKLFSPGDWKEIDGESQYQIKVASVGLGPNDQHDAAKRVDPYLLHRLKQAELNSDCFYVHKTAMGGSHRYGPNRWGDGFREEILARDHHSFEQNAKAYRQHKHTGPYYGHVKLSHFNPGSGVVELITEYYGTQKVASANGGRVADEELESLRKQGYIPVSMGSLVPGDRCSVCDHWAPKPKDRCSSEAEGGKCGLFGCKTGMLKIASDGRMNFVDNPTNSFYDISKVGVGADPVASGILLPVGDFVSKMAAMHKLSDFVYESLADTFKPLSAAENRAMQLAYMFADMEPKTADYVAGDLDPGYVSHKCAGFGDLAWLHRENTQRYRDQITLLARRGMLVDFESFAKSAGLSQDDIDVAAAYLPNLYSRLIDHRQLTAVVKRAAILQNPIKNVDNNFALDSGQAIDSASVLRRTCELNARQSQLVARKTAAADSKMPKVVADYAAMKLAFFTAREFVDPAMLYGAVRRDMFEIAHLPRS